MSQIYQLNGAIYPPGTVVQTLTPDSGTSPVVPDAANTINLVGDGVNIETVGSLNTVTVKLIGTTQYAVQVGSATNGLSSLALGNAGEVLTSNGAGADPSWQPASGGGFTWQVDTGVATNMVTLNGYIANNGAQTVFTLPATAAVGDTFRVTGMNNATGWKIAQNAGQTIHFGAIDTTTGATGYLESTATYDAVELVCNVANTDFIILSSVGNISVV